MTNIKEKALKKIWKLFQVFWVNLFSANSISVTRDGVNWFIGKLTIVQVTSCKKREIEPKLSAGTTRSNEEDYNLHIGKN